MRVSEWNEAVDTVLEVETPEHVRFRYPLAGPFRRAMAWLIDTVLRLGVLFVLALLAIFAGFSADSAMASTGIVLLTAFFLEWGYYVFFDTLYNGRSPGKRALRIRVITESGQPIRFWESFLRNLLRAADFLPTLYALGALLALRDEKFRRLGDMVAGTVVVVEVQQTLGEALEIRPKPTQEELEAIPATVVLDGQMLDAIELFLRRAPQLSPMRADELAQILTPHIGRKMGVKIHKPARFLALVYARAKARRSAS